MVTRRTEMRYWETVNQQAECFRDVAADNRPPVDPPHPRPGTNCVPMKGNK